ncbi:hypothetical protein FB107DRAFT_274473 [Schizophyllum commune]
MSHSDPVAQKARSRYGASIVGLPQLEDVAHRAPSPIQSRTPSQPKVEQTNANDERLLGGSRLLKGLRMICSGRRSTVIDPSAGAYFAPSYRNYCIPYEDGATPGPAFRKTKVSSHLCFIHRLPTELLCAIFMMCGDPNKLFAYPRNEQSDKTASQKKTYFYSWTTVTIGYVCSRWFHVTRSCPQLWTMIDVPLPKLCDIFAIKLSLKYSANLPLTLRVNDFHNTPAEHSGVIASTVFMRYVAASASRWEEMSIILLESTGLSDIIQPLLEVPRTAYSCLRRAMIRFESDNATGSTAMRLWEMFYASPVLRIAQWFYARIAPPQIVLHRLTHVGACVIDPDNLMNLLSTCPNLEVLQATVRPPPGVYPGREDGYLFPIISPPIVLSHLQNLQLGSMYDWSRFFDSVTISHIRLLRMTATGIQAPAISAMLRRSSARLDVLALRRLHAGNDGEVAALLRCHELQQLKIFCYHPYDGRCDRRPPDLFDPSPYLPPALVMYTKAYEDIEAMYDSSRII